MKRLWTRTWPGPGSGTAASTTAKSLGRGSPRGRVTRWISVLLREDCIWDTPEGGDDDSACLAGRPDEDLVERDPVRLADSKGDRRGDVLCLQRTDGIVETLCILANVIVTDVVGQLGGDGARFNDDHTYAGLNEFLAQSVRPGSEAPLGGVVNRVVGAGRAPCDRADVDDVALSGDKLRQKDVADEQHAGEVGVDHAPPLVDLAAGDRFTAGSCDLGRQTLDAPGAARQQRHRRALGCECPRRCLADATGGAGDDRRTSCKVLAHVVLHVWFRGCFRPCLLYTSPSPRTRHDLVCRL